MPAPAAGASIIGLEVNDDAWFVAMVLAMAEIDRVVSVGQEDDVPTEDPKTGIVALPATESSLADERTSYLQAISALALPRLSTRGLASLASRRACALRRRCCHSVWQRLRLCQATG